MRKNKQTEFVSVMGLEEPVKSTFVEELKEKKKFSLAPLWEVIKRKWKTITIVSVVVVLVLGIFFGAGFYFEYKYQLQLQEEYNKAAKENVTYFASENSEPEKSKTELTAIITEAYYTNDGSLAVYFCFANGMEKAQILESVEVCIKNDEEQVIASGFSDAIREDYTIAANDTATLLLYIQPEYVKISNDALDTISYDITTKYYEVE